MSKKLQVGDKILGHKYSRYTNLFVIDRVTKTQAISGTTKFRREYTIDGWIVSIPSNVWGPSYHIATEKRLEEYRDQKERNEAISTLRNAPYSEMRTEDLKRLYDLFNKLTQPKKR